MNLKIFLFGNRLSKVFVFQKYVLTIEEKFMRCLKTFYRTTAYMLVYARARFTNVQYETYKLLYYA